MTVTLLVAADSIRALLHQRLLVALMLVMLGLTAAFSMAVSGMKESVLEAAELAAEAEGTDLDEEGLKQARQQIDMAGSFLLAAFYWFAAFGGTAVTVFICSTAVATDLRRGTIRMVLAKPVSRTQFLLGKYCGAIAVMFGYSLLAGIALVIFTRSVRRHNCVTMSDTIAWERFSHTTTCCGARYRKSWVENGRFRGAQGPLSAGSQGVLARRRRCLPGQPRRSSRTILERRNRAGLESGTARTTPRLTRRFSCRVLMRSASAAS